MTRSVVLALVVALALAGCSGSKFSLSASEPQVEPNLVPANLKAELLTFLQVYLEDPTGVRDAFLAPPVLRPFGLENRYVACVRYNSRDYEKKYSGGKEKAAIYFGGKLNQFIDATPELCGGAQYQPFPELQALKRLNS